MTPKEQLAEWIKGLNIHNHDNNECCPDFACCREEGHWPTEVRKKFASAYLRGDDETVQSMLMMSLTSAVLSVFEDEVYITGQGAIH
jgi:hypothetical protein